MRNVHTLDVFKHMVDTDNQALKIAPLGNILSATKVKHGTKITIGFGEDVVGAILNGELVGGLILCRKSEFNKVKQELESAGPTPGGER